jgi:hypothetical protein
MKLMNRQLKDLKLEERYLLSYPVRGEVYADLKEQIAAFVFIVVNTADEIIFGVDYYLYLVSQGIEEAEVGHVDIPESEALILNYNLKDKLTGVNLYEKLVFIHKVLPLVQRQDIYNMTQLDININPQLEKHIDVLLGETFKSLLIQERVTLKAALGVCKFEDGDRAVLLDLFSRVSFSSSHQLKILELCEEVLFRDKCGMGDIFQKLGIGELLELEKPQKMIIEALFKYRSPIYVQSETQWQEEVKGLNLPNNMHVTHFPFFEKRQLELTIRLDGIEELKALLGIIT